MDMDDGTIRLIRDVRLGLVAGIREVMHPGDLRVMDATIQYGAGQAPRLEEVL